MQLASTSQPRRCVLAEQLQIIRASSLQVIASLRLTSFDEQRAETADCRTYAARQAGRQAGTRTKEFTGATMMKRSTKESVQDVLASKEVYVSVSKTPAVTKFIWHVNPKDVEEEEEELKRKSPNARYLQGISACLTVMVLWGIFWQVNNQLVPSIFSIGSASRAEPYRLAEMNYNAFQGDSSADLVSSVGGRRAASKLLLQVNAEEQISSKPQQSDETTWGGNLAAVLHRNLRSHVDRASAN